MTRLEYDAFVARLECWSAIGERIVANGTRLIGHVPHIAPEAYLHLVFPGLTEVQLQTLEQSIERPIPYGYRQFLTFGNGVHLFTKLALDGLRFTYERHSDASRQPFHMKDQNIRSRPKGADSSAVFIGGYSFDGSSLFMLPGDERVYHCPRFTATPILNTWPDLNTYLNAEIDRLEPLFDKEGKILDPRAPTVPAPGTARAHR